MVLKLYIPMCCRRCKQNWNATENNFCNPGGYFGIPFTVRRHFIDTMCDVCWNVFATWSIKKFAEIQYKATRESKTEIQLEKNLCKGWEVQIGFETYGIFNQVSLTEWIAEEVLHFAKLKLSELKRTKRFSHYSSKTEKRAVTRSAPTAPHEDLSAYY
jgi:hypothetical protein